MSITEENQARFNALDIWLREDTAGAPGEFLTPDGQAFVGWYTRLLSTLAYVTDGDDLVFGRSVVAEGSAHLVVVTSSSVIVADVANVADEDEHVMARIVPRSAIRSMSVAVSMRHDIQSSRLVGWPGVVTVSADYEGLADPVVIKGDSYDRYAEDRVGAIVRLHTALRADLSGR